MKRVAGFALALFTLVASASLENDGVWASGVWATTPWASGVWFEEDGGGCVMCVSVPNVIGEASSAAADAILEGDDLDLGGVTERCSDEADNEVVGQAPPAGTMVESGSLVDLLVSNGVECKLRGGAGVRPKLRLGL